MTYRFEEGDVLEFRGNKYRVKQVDKKPISGEVTQYRLKALGDSPEATLIPESDGLIVKEYHDVEEIEVKK